MSARQVPVMGVQWGPVCQHKAQEHEKKRTQQPKGARLQSLLAGRRVGPGQQGEAEPQAPAEGQKV